MHLEIIVLNCPSHLNCKYFNLYSSTHRFYECAYFIMIINMWTKFLFALFELQCNFGLCVWILTATLFRNQLWSLLLSFYFIYKKFRQLANILFCSCNICLTFLNYNTLSSFPNCTLNFKYRTNFFSHETVRISEQTVTRSFHWPPSFQGVCHFLNTKKASLPMKQNKIVIVRLWIF